MKKETIKESILNPVSMFIIGLLTGFLIKEIDIHISADFISYFFGSRSLGSNRGEYQSVQQREKICHAECFYILYRNDNYILPDGRTYRIGLWLGIYKMWTLFACFSPVMAYLVILTKRKGILAFVIKAGIFIGYISINLLLGSFIKIYDIVFIGILIYLLFIKKYTKI